MILECINYWTVLVCAILYMAIGAAWFSPYVFGKQWAKMMKLTANEKKHPKYMYAILFASNLLLFWVLSILIFCLGATTWIEGASVAFMCWLGFIVPVAFDWMLWEKKSFDLFLLQNSYCVLSFILLGGLLAIWR